jgi:hypothetical protein
MAFSDMPPIKHIVLAIAGFWSNPAAELTALQQLYSTCCQEEASEVTQLCTCTLRVAVVAHTLVL